MHAYHECMATLPATLNSMTKARMYSIFLEFRALSWAAKELKVNKGTFHRWLIGDRPAVGLHLYARACKLAKRLLDTNGEAKHDIDGRKSVRSQIKRIRRSK